MFQGVWPGVVVESPGRADSRFEGAHKLKNRALCNFLISPFVFSKWVHPKHLVADCTVCMTERAEWIFKCAESEWKILKAAGQPNWTFALLSCFGAVTFVSADNQSTATTERWWQSVFECLNDWMLHELWLS